MSFDRRWLTAPVDRRAVAAFTADLRRRGVRDPRAAGVIAAAVAIGLVAVMVMTFVSLAAWFVGGPLLGLLLWLAATGGIVYGCIAVSAKVITAGGEIDYRLAGFAAANGMAYEPQPIDPSLPGLIFHHGDGRLATQRVRGTQPRFVEFGNHRYSTGSGKHRTVHRWGYIAIHLDTPLPHIVLDAKGNDALFGSNLPASFDRHQRLSLEGDFDAFFTLYCPEGYEPDALYLFTPDIMVRFMAAASQLDAEIVDDWLFLYGPGEFSTANPDMWAWLFSVVSALIDKIQRWERWRDERLALASDRPRALPMDGQALPFPLGLSGGAPAAPTARAAAWTAPAAPVPGPIAPPFPTAGAPRRPKGVAPQGRRLRRRVPVWAIVTLVVTLGAFLLSVLAPIVAALSGR